MSGTPPTDPSAALCRHCGMKIKRGPAGEWRHIFTGEQRCGLEARPVSAWGGQ